MDHKIELLFLGTAAADFSPRLKTDCKNRFDKNARRASCMLVGTHYMIDCGMYALESLRIAKADISQITDIFLTHLHADHFNPENIAFIADGKEKPLRIWVRRDAVLPDIANTEIVPIHFHTVMPVSDEMTVESVDANHDPDAFPQYLVFTINGKRLMYALDGAWFLTATYNYLRDRNLDMLVLDATCGDYTGDYRMAAHNSIPMIRLMLPSLKARGIINDQTRIYLSHLAPRLHLPHDETAALVAKDGLFVAYDGLELEL